MDSLFDDAPARLARDIRLARETRGWSLADLAQRAGVAKATLSKIERLETSPTAVTLCKIASAFGMTLATLLASSEAAAPRCASREQQPVWRDPLTGYDRRQVFIDPHCPLELTEVRLPAGASVSFPASSYARIRQVAWVLEGALTVIEGEAATEVAAGARYAFGPPADTCLRNKGEGSCRYLIALVRT